MVTHNPDLAEEYASRTVKLLDGEIISDSDPYESTPESEHLAEVRQISKTKKSKKDTGLSVKYKIGDSVMVLPDKKIGIVCEPINEKGVLRVQMPNKKIYINHKRVKLHVAATELYPEDYDFSIVFETVENRKKRHDMDRKFTDVVIEYKEGEN